MTFESGGGGGGGGTPWYSTSIDTMWAWVNRDLSAHYEQATSWKKASELYGLYQYRLQAFRDKLAQAWNPDNSPAARAYLTKLDELILAVKDLDGVANRNYQASVDIPNAMSEAKYKLKPIYEAYKAEQRGENDEATLNRHQTSASSVMYTLSGDLSRAQAGLGRPAPYEAPMRRDDAGNYSGAGGGMPPAFVPPVVPTRPPVSAPPPGPMGPFPGPNGPTLGGEIRPPGLGPGLPPSPFPTPPPPGGGAPPIIPGVPPGVIAPPPPGPGAPPASGARPPLGIIGGAPGATPPRGPGVPGGVIGGAAPGGRGPANAGLRPNPVGGMIPGGAPGARGPAGIPGAGVSGVVGRGGTPGVSGTGAAGVAGRPGGAGATRPGAAGGTAGGTGAAGVAGRAGGANTARPGAAGGAGAAGAAGRGGLVGAVGAAGKAGRRDEDGEHYDPDTTWDVAQGVTPVLDAPAVQGPIDPGPAIGLSR